ncbi:MAG: HNH endonuclease [Thermoplasmatales archaeon]|nr:MAG: HNH endonuclease [Thermoplasmatales archaeon]
MPKNIFEAESKRMEEMLYGKKPSTQRKRFSRTEEKTIYDKYKHKCAICGRKTEFGDGEIDHIKPLSKGGSNRLSNLQWLCHRCNKLKGHKRTNAQVKKALGIKSKTKKTITPKKKTTKRRTTRRRKPRSSLEVEILKVKPPKFKF